MNAEDFAERFVGTTAGPALELRMIVEFGVRKALGGDPRFSLPPGEVAAILRQAAALLNPPPPSLGAPKPWWSLKR